MKNWASLILLAAVIAWFGLIRRMEWPFTPDHYIKIPENFFAPGEQAG